MQANKITLINVKGWEDTSYFAYLIFTPRYYNYVMCSERWALIRSNVGVSASHGITCISIYCRKQGRPALDITT